MARVQVCGASPNCVSTRDERWWFAMPALRLTGPTKAAREAIVAVLEDEPRTEIHRAEAAYVHTVCRSAVFGFCDDVIFEIDEVAGVVHYRSASRLGWFDFGVNRRRMRRLAGRLRGQV